MHVKVAQRARLVLRGIVVLASPAELLSCKVGSRRGSALPDLEAVAVRSPCKSSAAAQVICALRYAEDAKTAINLSVFYLAPKT
jgi:hypothetical protein